MEMKRSATAQWSALASFVVAAVLFVVIGKVVGAAKAGPESSLTVLTTTDAKAFNWLLGLLAAAPFVVAAAVLLAAAWLLADSEASRPYD